MLTKCLDMDACHWEQLLPTLLFAVQEVAKASTGLSPFKLLYCHNLRESWIFYRKYGKNNSSKPIMWSYIY